MPAVLGYRERKRWMRGSRKRRFLTIICWLIATWQLLIYCKRVAKRRELIGKQDLAFVKAVPLPVPISTSETVENESPGEIPKLCSRHGWRPFPQLQSRRKIYDLFMINSELDWLEIRLNELDGHVDYFVILESLRTFTGIPKALNLQENWDRFEKFRSRIIYHVLEDPPMESHTTWVHEDFQRNAMFTHVLPFLTGDQAPNLGDVIIVSDIDEVPRTATLSILRNCDFPRRLTLRSQFYYYGFQWLHKGKDWAHPQATTYQGPGRTILPADLRNGEGGSRILNWFEKANLRNAGWHCSSCFSTIEELLTKMSSFSHTKYNKEEFRDPTRIVDRVRHGKDLWDREGEEYVKVYENNDTPKILRENRERFGYMLDREGGNAGFSDYGGID